MPFVLSPLVNAYVLLLTLRIAPIATLVLFYFQV